MAESKKLITKNKRLLDARQMLESISEPANTSYYVFLGNHISYENTGTIPQPVDSISETVVDVYRNMIYGKRLSENDAILMINRNDYESNKVFEMYDDQSGESNLSFFDSNYYAVVNADSYYHVFKCLDNNGGTNSTVQPEFSEIDVADEFYQTSDGYVWKYMYSVDSSTVRKFATNDFFPIKANNAVSAAAKEGIINVIKVESAGRGYDNYCNGTFNLSDLRLSGNTLHYSINSSQNANNVSNFYNGCYVYITAGTGVGQYSKINDYIVNSTVKKIVLDTEFSVPPSTDSAFEITPGVIITGEGSETLDAEARAIVNTTGNVIQRIEMLNLGQGYKYATAYIDVDSVVGVSNNAILRPIYSPPGGHGFDAARELGATRLGLSVKFANTDISIPTTNDYRTIGIIRDPLFANVEISFDTANGTFLPTENVYSVRGVRVSSAITLTADSTEVSGDEDFVNQFAPGEFIYFKTDNGYQLATVNAVTNSSHMTISQNGYYSCTASEVFKTNISSTIANVNLTTTSLTGTISVNTTSANMNGTGTSFTSELSANASHVFVYANSTGSGVIKKVLTVVSDTRAILDSACAFTNTSAKGQIIDYTINPSAILTTNSASGKITSVSVGSMLVNSVSGVFSVNDFIIGDTSGATGVVTAITRNGTVKNFDTFSQMNKYVGTLSSGTFTQDEMVFQSPTNSFTDNYANGMLHSVVSIDGGIEMYLTKQLGVFNAGDNIIGNTSTAIAEITNKYSPEIVFGSGEVIYLEKLDAIPRSTTSAETLKFIFEF